MSRANRPAADSAGSVSPYHPPEGLTVDVPAETPARLAARLLAEFTATELAVAVSVLPPSWLAVIVVALDVAHARDEDVTLSGYAGGRYHRGHDLGWPTEYERRRYPPHGDRDRWVREGPQGHVNYPGRGGEAVVA